MQVVGRDAFQQEPGGAGPQRRGQALVVVECRQHEHGRGVGALTKFGGGRDPVDGRHPHVHHHDVRTQPVDRGGDLAAVAALTDDLEPEPGAQDAPQAGPDELLVVHQQDPDHG